jgi:hypothetical protein
MKHKKQREIHAMEYETELLHYSHYSSSLKLPPSSTSSFLSSHSLLANKATSTAAIYSINDTREYVIHPRLLPLISDATESYPMPNKNRFLKIEESDEESINDSDQEVSRMLFIPLRGENQISLSQSSTETESIPEVFPLSSFEKKRKPPKKVCDALAPRKALGRLTNRPQKTDFSPTFEEEI